MLPQEVVLDQGNKKKVRHEEELIGTSIIRRDTFTGKKFWVTWDGDGHNEVTYSAGQALVFPPDELRIGTRLHFLPPEEQDD